MKVPIRLYKRHDLDLIYLNKSKEFSLSKAMKVALYGYIHGERFYINTPHEEQFSCDNINGAIYFTLNLNETYDEDIIDFINTMPKGFRNSMIKNIVRSYLYNPNIMCYFDDFELGKKYHDFKDDTIYRNTDTFKYYKTIKSEQTNVSVIEVVKSKTKYKKKLGLKDIPDSELGTAILEDKYLDENYMKQFEKNNEKEIEPDKKKNIKENKIVNKLHKKSESSEDKEKLTIQDEKNTNQNSESIDLFSEMENMMNGMLF